MRRELGDVAPDLAVVVRLAAPRAGVRRRAERVRAALEPRVLVGCSAGGVIGGGARDRGRGGLPLTAARLPDV